MAELSSVAEAKKEKKAFKSYLEDFRHFVLKDTKGFIDVFNDSNYLVKPINVWFGLLQKWLERERTHCDNKYTRL